MEKVKSFFKRHGPIVAGGALASIALLVIWFMGNHASNSGNANSPITAGLSYVPTGGGGGVVGSSDSGAPVNTPPPAPDNSSSTSSGTSALTGPANGFWATIRNAGASGIAAIDEWDKTSGVAQGGIPIWSSPGGHQIGSLGYGSRVRITSDSVQQGPPNFVGPGSTSDYYQIDPGDGSVAWISRFDVNRLWQQKPGNLSVAFGQGRPSLTPRMGEGISRARHRTFSRIGT